MKCIITYTASPYCWPSFQMYQIKCIRTHTANCKLQGTHTHTNAMWQHCASAILEILCHMYSKNWQHLKVHTLHVHLSPSLIIQRILLIYLNTLLSSGSRERNLPVQFQPASPNEFSLQVLLSDTEASAAPGRHSDLGWTPKIAPCLFDAGLEVDGGPGSPVLWA